MKCPFCGSDEFDSGHKEMIVFKCLTYIEGEHTDQSPKCIEIDYERMKKRVKALEEAGDAFAKRYKMSREVWAWNEAKSSK